MCICCCQTKKSIGVALLSLGIILLIVNLIPLTIFSSNTLEYRNVLNILDYYGYRRSLVDEYININNNIEINNDKFNKNDIENVNETLRNLLRSDGKIRYIKLYRKFKSSEKGLEVFKFIFSFIWLFVSIIIFILFTRYVRIEPTDPKAQKTIFIIFIYWILAGINIIIIFALVIVRSNALECYKDTLDIDDIDNYDNFENRNFYGMYLDILSIILLLNCMVLAFRAFQFLKNPDLIIGRKVGEVQNVYYNNRVFLQTVQNGQIVLIPANPNLIQPIQGPVPVNYNAQPNINNNYPNYINIPLNQDGSIVPQFMYNNQLYTINPTQQQVNQNIEMQQNNVNNQNINNNQNNNNNTGNEDLIGNSVNQIEEKYA